jgi:pyruvate dehydrogenase E1 component alpha subunit
LLSAETITSDLDLKGVVALTAAIDSQMTRLSEAGLIAPHQACTGEEAALVGAVAAMEAQDWIFWGRQVNVAALWRGLSVSNLFSQALFGGLESEIAALNIVNVTHGPASRLPHAVGLAWAAKNDGVVALCELGDGALSDGDFHVGVNFAGVMNAPVVFVVRSGGDVRVSERAEGYGVRSMIVQSEDAETVRRGVAEAADLARQGEGPTLVELQVSRVALSHDQQCRYESTVAKALAQAEAQKKNGGVR